eukprot:12328007-Heterocapsa_arctica.AAC.1
MPRGSNSVQVLLLRNADWTNLQQRRSRKKVIRRTSKKQFTRWEQPWVNWFGLRWFDKALERQAWVDAMPELVASVPCR